MEDYKDFNDYEVMYMIGEKSEDATNLLFEKYKPLIKKYARKYYPYGYKYGLEFQDFIQEGYLGLYLAIRNYTDNKNSLFYTYVIVCIKSKMLSLIRTNSTKGNYILNNSISLYASYSDNDDIIINHIKDDKLLPEKVALYNETIKIIKNLIYASDIDKATILELRYNGFSKKEIAEILDISLSSVVYTLSSYRKKLGLIVENYN